MFIDYTAINNTTEDTVITVVNDTTICINGIYYTADTAMTSFDQATIQSLSNNYIESVTINGGVYYFKVIKLYTKNNSTWAYKGYVDVSGQYTNEEVVDPILLTNPIVLTGSVITTPPTKADLVTQLMDYIVNGIAIPAELTDQWNSSL